MQYYPGELLAHQLQEWIAKLKLLHLTHASAYCKSKPKTSAMVVGVYVPLRPGFPFPPLLLTCAMPCSISGAGGLGTVEKAQCDGGAGGGYIWPHWKRNRSSKLPQGGSSLQIRSSKCRQIDIVGNETKLV